MLPWTIVAACWALDRLLGLEEDQLHQRLLELEALWPEARTGLTIEGSSLTAVDLLTPDERTLRGLIAVAASARHDEARPDWLLGSLIEPRRRKLRGDSLYPLSYTLHLLREAQSAGTILDDDTTTRALAVIEQLAARQDELLAAKNDSA